MHTTNICTETNGSKYSVDDFPPSSVPTFKNSNGTEKSVTSIFVGRRSTSIFGTFILLNFALVLVGFSSTVIAASENSSIELSIKAEKEIVITDSDGGNATRRVDIALLDSQLARSNGAKVAPGDEIIYTITYTNNSEDIATDLVITNPIPEHTVYESNSAEGSNSRIEFSIDGSHFASAGELMVTSADGRTRRANSQDYSHVRWVLVEPLMPGQVGNLAYRVVLK